ncbi:MAG: hypothetical protein GSR72_03485 [Desulfurococcales archaeon]|nr:hypothetical protein [Desulfurococcales archaeon]MEB3788936.1 hypothetical protein [Desulfurococcales archaeon]
MNKLIIKYNEQGIETTEEYYYLNKNSESYTKIIKLEVKPIIHTKKGLILYVDTSPSMDGEILYKTRKRLEKLIKAKLLDKIEVYSWCSNVKGPTTPNKLKICEGSNLEKTLKHALLRSNETRLDPLIITDFEITSGTKNKKKLCKIISELKNLKHEPLFLVNKTDKTDQEIYTYLKEECSTTIYELDPEYVDAQVLLLTKRASNVPIDIKINNTINNLDIVKYLETPIYQEKYKLTKYIFIQERRLIGVRIVSLAENRNIDTGIAQIYLNKIIRLDELESLRSIVV